MCIGLLLPLPVIGQTADDGSVYSRYGIGELRSSGSSRAMALGGGGTALWSPQYASFGNPASWSQHVLVHAAAGVRFEGLQTTDATNGRKLLRSGALDALQFGIPLKSNQLGMGISFEPFSRMNYAVTTQGSLIIDPRTGTATIYRLRHGGSGGLQRLRAGIGVRPSSWLTLGISADYLFGITEETRRTTFASVAYAETNISTSTRMRGVTTTVGTIVRLTEVFGDRDRLSFAGSVTLPATIHANRALTLGESLNRDTLGTKITGDMTLPSRIQAGASYSIDDRWTTTADLLYEPWESFESDLALAGYAPGKSSTLRNRVRYSGGLELLPAGTNQLEPYLARIAYRLGFYVDGLYAPPTSTADINTRALTAGLSLPALRPGTRIDLTFQLGTRGSHAPGLVRDRFLGLSITVNVGERWFVKRRLG